MENTKIKKVEYTRSGHYRICLPVAMIKAIGGERMKTHTIKIEVVGDKIILSNIEVIEKTDE